MATADITNIILGDVDWADDVELKTTFALLHTADYTCKLISAQIAILGIDDEIITISEPNEFKTTLKPGQKTDLAFTSEVKSYFIDTDSDDLRIRAKIGLFQRTSAKTEVLQAPEIGRNSRTFSACDWLRKPISISATRFAPDNEGNSKLRVEISLDGHDWPYKLHVALMLRDEDGVVTDSRNHERDVWQNQFGYVDSGFYGVKDSAVAGSTIEVEILLYRLMEVLSVDHTYAHNLRRDQTRGGSSF